MVIKTVFFTPDPPSLLNAREKEKDTPHENFGELFAANDSELFCQTRLRNKDEAGLGIYNAGDLRLKEFYSLGTSNDYADIERIAWSGNVLGLSMRESALHDSSRLVFLKDKRLFTIYHPRLKGELCNTLYWDPKEKLFVDCSFTDNQGETNFVYRRFISPDGFSVVKTDTLFYPWRKPPLLLVDLYMNQDHLFGEFLSDSFDIHPTRVIEVQGRRLVEKDRVDGNPVPVLNNPSWTAAFKVHEDSCSGYIPVRGMKPEGHFRELIGLDSIGRYNGGYVKLEPAGLVSPHPVYELKNVRRKAFYFGDKRLDLDEDTLKFYNAKGELLKKYEKADFYYGEVVELPGRVKLYDFGFRESMEFDAKTLERIDRIGVMEKFSRSLFPSWDDHKRPWWFRMCFWVSLLGMPLPLLFLLIRKIRPSFALPESFTVQRMCLLYLAFAIPACWRLIEVLSGSW
jgi:hypothetical protein